MPESPAPQSAHDDPDRGRAEADAPARSKRKKWAVLGLALLGLGLIGVGLLIYPLRAAVQATAPPAVTVGSRDEILNNDISLLAYTVDQIHPDLAKVTIDVYMGGGGSWQPGPYLTVTLDLSGQYIAGCSPQCTRENNPPYDRGDYFGSASFQPKQQYGVLRAVFLVRASSFGAPANGATAEATLPQVVVSGLAPGPATLTVQYNNFPSPGSYDWAADPPQKFQGSSASWIEPIAIGTTVSRILVGTNRAAQQRDSDRTLLAGILFGIAGGALVAAVQEALHD